MVKAELPPNFYIQHGIWKKIYSPEELAEINGKLNELLTGTPIDELKTSSVDNIRERKKPTVRIRLNHNDKSVKLHKLMSGKI